MWYQAWESYSCFHLEGRCEVYPPIVVCQLIYVVARWSDPTFICYKILLTFAEGW